MELGQQNAPPGPRCGSRPPSPIFVLAIFRFGAPMELGRSGRRRSGASAAEVGGHRQRSPNSAAVTLGARLCSRWVLLGKISGIWQSSIGPDRNPAESPGAAHLYL